MNSHNIKMLLFLIGFVFVFYFYKYSGDFKRNMFDTLFRKCDNGRFLKRGLSNIFSIIEEREFYFHIIKKPVLLEMFLIDEQKRVYTFFNLNDVKVIAPFSHPRDAGKKRIILILNDPDNTKKEYTFKENEFIDVKKCIDDYYD